jgi:hypothetical protein
MPVIQMNCARAAARFSRRCSRGKAKVRHKTTHESGSRGGVLTTCAHDRHLSGEMLQSPRRSRRANHRKCQIVK